MLRLLYGVWGSPPGSVFRLLKHGPIDAPAGSPPGGLWVSACAGWQPLRYEGLGGWWLPAWGVVLPTIPSLRLDSRGQSWSRIGLLGCEG